MFLTQAVTLMMSYICLGASPTIISNKIFRNLDRGSASLAILFFAYVLRQLKRLTDWSHNSN